MDKSPMYGKIFVFFLLCSLPLFSQRSEKMEFWTTQKKGANGALHNFRPEWFEAAADAGLQFVRFAPDNLPPDGRDFLIGNADDFTAVNTILKS